MRCVACDKMLSALEMSRKSSVTNEDFLLCTKCLQEAGLLVFSIENPLAENEDQTDPDFYDQLGDHQE